MKLFRRVLWVAFIAGTLISTALWAGVITTEVKVSIKSAAPVYQSALRVPAQDLTKYIYEVKANAVRTGAVRPSEKRFTSWHIGEGYIVTATHCVEYPSLLGWYSTPMTWTKPVYTIDDREIKLIGSIQDVALLYDKELIGEPAVTFANSDLIPIGTRVVDVGNSMMMGVNIKEGMISRTDITLKAFSTDAVYIKANTFVISIPVNGGDSGSPMFAWNTTTNQYEVAGMVFAGATAKQGYNMAFKSNYVKAVIAEIKGGRLNKYGYRDTM